MANVTHATDQLFSLQKEEEEEREKRLCPLSSDILITLFVFLIFVCGQHEAWPEPADVKE